MLEEAFRTELWQLQATRAITEHLWEEVRVHHSKPGRYYHTLTHLDTLITELTAVRNDIQDWQTLVFSVAYHDIVYNPLQSDNEIKSAQLAQKRLTELSIPFHQIDKCRSQILATKGHSVSDDSDTNYFTDADLSILGAAPERYHHYSAMIRKEYRLLPDLVYKPGRRKVLAHFLQMSTIYKTDYFQNRYEDQARRNIEWELQELS